MIDELIKPEKKGEFLKILFENGVKSLKKVTGIRQSHTPKTLEKKLDNLSKEYKFQLKNPCFYLFYNLGTFGGDFDIGYLYPPDLTEYFLINDPKLNNIINISKKITKLIQIPLLAIYETDRFAIPKLQLYEKGELIKESKSIEKKPYDPDYWKKDIDKALESFKSASKSGLTEEIMKDYYK